MSSYEKCISLIKEICDASELGHEIIREARQKELRWVFIDSQTKQEWYFPKISLIQRLSSTDQKTFKIIEFLNGLPAKETLEQIEALEKLKAFW